MGWSGGTKIFDTVADELIDLNDELVTTHEVVFPLKNVYRALCDQDWDQEAESKYWEHPIIGRILGNDELHDNWN